MSRIVFITSAPPDGLAGGVKVVHRHAALLAGAGLDALVFAPRGRPVWFRSEARLVTDARLAIRHDDVLIFGEDMDEGFAASLGLPCQREMYCQNHHYLFHDRLGERDHFAAGFRRVYSASHAIQAFLEGTMGYDGIDVVPPPIDPSLFRPEPKRLRIAFLPRKLPEHAAFIRAVFRRRNPDLGGVEWIEIANRHEEEVAEILASSAVFLSLAHREGLGMVALEAMACGCAVVGFHGMGGLDYATPQNGRWFLSDELIACADALAEVVRGIDRGDPAVAAMVDASRAAAAAYEPERVRANLLAHFGDAPC